jgi:adenine-specific DNA methylase
MTEDEVRRIMSKRGNYGIFKKEYNNITLFIK